MYQRNGGKVEVFYEAGENEANQLTVSQSGDGSTLFLSDPGATIAPLPPQSSSLLPCAVVGQHSAVCSYPGPAIPTGPAADYSIVHASLGGDGPDSFTLVEGGPPPSVEVSSFGALDASIPSSQSAYVTGGAGDMNVHIGSERSPGTVALGWGANRLFAHNHQTDYVYCQDPSIVGSASQRLLVDAIDTVDADCSGVVRLP
jgi:hypothetical protein